MASSTTSTINPASIAALWLSRLQTALLSSTFTETSKHVRAVAFARLFTPSAYLRDTLVFTWDTRTIHTRALIEAYVATALENPTSIIHEGLDNVRLDDRDPIFEPHVLEGDQPGAVELGFRFKTSLGQARGMTRLFARPTSRGDDEWDAGSAYFALDSLDSHEERPLQAQEVPPKSQDSLDTSPYVLVVGAGQTGLIVSARFKAFGISHVVIEKSPRVGDGWRDRYEILCLNTPKAHHSLLYESYPDDWPEYTPKDQMGDWLEQYAISSDLPVWTSSTFASPPSYDEQAKRWTVRILRSDAHGKAKIIDLQPFHIVLATGTLGPPRIPEFPDSKLFSAMSKIMHSSEYKYPASIPLLFPHNQKRKVLIVGSGNTAADIALDLIDEPIEVTMLQRGPTCVAFPAAMDGYWGFAHPPGVDIDKADFRLNAVPRALRTTLIQDYMKTAKEGKGQRTEDPEDARRRSMLEAGGFRIWDGKDGLGVLGDINERFSGHLSDIGGFSSALAEGEFSVKAGEIARFTESGVVLRTGEELETDAVVLATGYEDPRTTWASIMGPEIIERAGPGWGTDEEGELKGAYRPLKHDGLYYATGDFTHARVGSKILALMLLYKMNELR